MTTFSLSFVERKYYLPALVETHDGHVLDCAICNDGQLYLFAFADVATILATYPQDREGWFFNTTRDRYIAELCSWNKTKVAVNPSFVTKHFPTIVI